MDQQCVEAVSGRTVGLIGGGHQAFAPGTPEYGERGRGVKEGWPVALIQFD
jgi:hypothetical protein